MAPPERGGRRHEDQGGGFRDKSGKASVETVDLEEPRDDEILVRVVATGVCHTDIKVSTTEGMSPRPIVLGHEGRVSSSASARA